MNTKTSSKKALSIFMLTMINVAAIASLRSLPVSASYGFSIIFIYILGAILFLIPSALVSAELATTYHNKQGGIYIWVEEAFGPKWGFLAIWMQFIENVIWYPTGLSFAAATLAYVINPALASNKLYMVCMIIGIFWAATLVNLKGMKASGWISSVGAFIGTLIPGIIIIILGILFWSMGKPLQITMSSKTFLPSFDLSNLVFTAGILFSFAGMEMSAVHAKDVQDPNKNYPKAIFISSCILVVLMTLGSLAIAFIIPQTEISLVAGLMEAFALFFQSFNIIWFTPVIALCIFLGTLSQVNTWLIGPVRGLYATKQHGILPKSLDKENKNKMPSTLLFSQAIIVSIISFVFLIMPDINSSYWVLAVLATQLYLIMYLLMFAAAIVLRYKKPNITRPYKVFGGNTGMFIVAGVGFLISLFVFGLGFIPPEQINTGSLFFYEGFLVLGIVVFSAIPFFMTPSKNKTT